VRLRSAWRRHTLRNFVPLSARQYFEAYSPPGKEASSSCVDRFEDAKWKVCEQRWLNEAFPNEGYALEGLGAEDLEMYDEQDAAGKTNERLSTLAQHALKVAVQHLCFDTDPDAGAEMLDDLMDSPGLDVPLVLSLPANGPVLSPSAAQLLVRLLQYTSPTDVAEGRLGLSSFSLGLQSIRTIVASFPNIVFLDLSSKGPALDSDILAHIGAALPRLQYLFLMGDATVRLNAEQLDALLCSGGALSDVHAVYHPALFTRSLIEMVTSLGRAMARPMKCQCAGYRAVKPEPAVLLDCALRQFTWPHRRRVQPFQARPHEYSGWPVRLAYQRGGGLHQPRPYRPYVLPVERRLQSYSFRRETARTGSCGPAHAGRDACRLGEPRECGRLALWHADLLVANPLSFYTFPIVKGKEKMHWEFVRRQHADASETQPDDGSELEVFDVDGWLGALGPQASAVDEAWAEKLKGQLRSLNDLPLLTPAHHFVQGI
jgi:hypothetical protein